MHERSLLPLANPMIRPPSAFLVPGPRGGGELSQEEERSAPSRRGQTRAGSAAPPPAPRRPARAAGPLSPRIMHGPGAPSALPPREDTIKVRGRAGRAGRRWLMVAEPRARGADWKSQRVGRPARARCVQRPRSSSSELPVEPSRQRKGKNARGGPRRSHKVARVSRPSPMRGPRGADRRPRTRA